MLSLIHIYLLNYVPAMSTQYTYMLTNLHPHTPQIGDVTNAVSGEMGGQLDINEYPLNETKREPASVPVLASV